MRPLLLSLVMLLSCGAPTTEVADAGGLTDSAADVGVPDLGPAVMCPVEGQLYCGEKCIDVTFDLDHCGSCGNACTRGRMTCMMGECLCLGDRLMCDDECFDTQTSLEHCGECGNACTAAEACVSGACRPIAEDPEILGVLVATNAGRASQQDCGVNGLRPAVGPVVLSDQLTAAAQRHAIDLAANRFLKHEGTDGSMPAQRARDAGYIGSTGENIAQGYATPDSVVAGWIASDEHCVNLMNGEFDEMGVGYMVDDATGNPYWVQLFGSR